MCVETLKRDWDSKLTLRDVLITISCLLIQPNPDSALNADAGALIQESYDLFAKRAELMTSIHAVIPKTMAETVREAQNRGQEPEGDDHAEETTSHAAEAPARRRRTIAQVRAARRTDTSPSGAPARRRHQPQPSQPFVLQAEADDVFGIAAPPRPNRPAPRMEEDDESMGEGEQENDSVQSPSKPTTPKPLRTPRRPHGVPVPLGELILEQSEEEEDEEMEAEYPPSPRKSPSKSPPKRKQAQLFNADSTFERPGSSRDAALRVPNLTPPNLDDQPLAEDSPFMMDVTFDESIQLRKGHRRLFDTPPKRAGKNVLGSSTNMTSGIRYSAMRTNKRKPSSPVDRESMAEQARAEANARLWMQCGQNVKRWNRGDFDGEPFKKKAARW